VAGGLVTFVCDCDLRVCVAAAKHQKDYLLMRLYHTIAEKSIPSDVENQTKIIASERY
jgi:hypothetical protein